MNKVILGLLLAVCVLGMALILLNERLRKPEPATVPPGVTEPTAPDAAPAPSPVGGMPGNTTAQLQIPSQEENSLPQSEQAGTATVHAPIPDVQPVPPALLPDVPASSTAPRPDERSTATGAQPEAAKPSAAPSTPQPATAKPAVPMPPVETATKKIAPTTVTSVKQAAQHRAITRIAVLVRDHGVTVRLTGSAPIVYRSMTLSSPERLVLDLDGKWQVKAPGVPKNSLVTNVRIGKANDKTRIVIDLASKAKNKIILSGNQQTLDVRLNR